VTGAARLRIRRARLADAPAVARVMRAAIRGLARGTYSPRQLAAWSSLPALYHAWAMTAGGERYLVAELGGRIAGYAARRGREVTAVFVLPAEARAGIGRMLLRGIERDARRAGIASVFVRAARGAAPFYAASGFRGRRPVRVPLPGGVALRGFTMRKRIA
jgi:N-acetylglutamate synthase-like GNAT family acetyltransferase